jgi:hypothetical protein
MATNRIQLKRTFTAGRTPNTTNSANSQYIAAGELALNLADNKLYTSNGSALIDLTAGGVGASVTVSETVPASPSAGDLWYYTGYGELYLYYNDGTSSQWVSAAGGGYAENANNATNANNASYLGGNTASTLRAYSDTVAATAYTNAVAYAASNSYVNSTFQTKAGLATNVATMSANNSAYLGGVIAAGYVQNADSKTLSGNLYFTAANNYFSQGFTSNGIVTISYTGSTNSSLVIGGTNTKGGAGYHDFLMARNNGAGVTNPNKWFRINSTGGLEILNSAYSSVPLTLSDAGNLTVTGAVATTGVNINNKQAVNGPAFSAYASAVTTIATDVLTKVNFATEEYDTNDNFASSRFTPTVEGYYQLNSTVRMSGASGTGEMMIVLYKNGSEYHRGWNSQGQQIGSGWWSMSVSSTAYANGGGDYFEIYVQHGAGVNRDTTSGATITWFNGCMLRGA